MKIFDWFRKKPAPVAFDFGKNSRRLNAIPSITSDINTLIRAYGMTVVARSRYLCANAPYASSAKESFVAQVIGDGIVPSSLDTPRRKDLRDIWADWALESDVEGLTDFYGQQALCAHEMYEAGECFFRIRERRPEDGLTLPFQLEMIPAEMLPLWKNEPGIGAGASRIEMGIEFDAIGKRTAYHFLRNHPGSSTQVLTGQNFFTRVPASQVLHVFRPIRAGQIRGVPIPLSAMITLAMGDLYDDAELERKRTAALFAMFVTKPPLDPNADNPLGVPVNPSASSPDQYTVDPGAVVTLANGEDIKFAEPADVGASYDSFQYRMGLRSSAGLGVPYMQMTGDLRQANFGSIRAGEINARRRWAPFQKHTFIFQLVRPVWRRALRYAALTGVGPWTAAEFAADEKKLSRAVYITPKWDWIDPLNDAKAEELSINMRIKARSDVMQGQGRDPEDTDERIAADQERLEKLGVKPAGGTPPPAPPPDDPPPDDPATDEPQKGTDNAS